MFLTHTVTLSGLTAKLLELMAGEWKKSSEDVKKQKWWSICPTRLFLRFLLVETFPDLIRNFHHLNQGGAAEKEQIGTGIGGIGSASRG